MATTEPFSWGADTLERRAISGEGGGSGASKRAPSLIGARVAAMLIDGLVLLVPVFAIDLLLSVVFPNHGFFFARTASPVDSTQTASVHIGPAGLLMITALSLSYFFVCEARTGQTVGKGRMGIRVVAASGGQASIGGVSARTVLRLIDSLPFLYLVGLLVALVTGPRRRRIGDWFGATVVVRESEAPERKDARTAWKIAAYPTIWIACVMGAIFAFGLGTTAREREQAPLAQIGQEGTRTAQSPPARPVAAASWQPQLPGTCQIPRPPEQDYLPPGEWTATETVLTTTAIDACAGEQLVGPWRFRHRCLAGACGTFLFTDGTYSVGVALVVPVGRDRYVAVFKPSTVPCPHRPGEDAGINRSYSKMTLWFSPHTQTLYGLSQERQVGPCGGGPLNTSRFVAKRTNPAQNPPAEGP